MKYKSLLLILGLLLLVSASVGGRFQAWSESNKIREKAAGREEVVFWHFWGGRDRDVVEDVVARFNESQTVYFVRPIAMPGNNLQAKLFLSVTGGDPPDLVNQDDPVLADWSARGVIQPIESIATAAEIRELREWMFDSAARLSLVDNKFVGVCNGLDIRALYYNKTLLDRNGLSPPVTLDDLDAIAESIAPPGDEPNRAYYGYLPDSRRIWAWGYVFGGRFFDADKSQVVAHSKAIVAALEWQQSYSRQYGADNLASFRKGDQSLPGKPFPLLPVASNEMVGRYGLIMDGQWRVRDINEFVVARRKIGIDSPSFGVCPLPSPVGGKRNSGWVNGNFFVVPTGAKNPAGAWAFMKFWIGIGNPSEAAKTCAAGGWIPVSKSVVDTDEFQDFLESNPLFDTFVELAASPEQYPTPIVSGAAMFKRTIESAGYEAMTNPEKDAADILREASERIQRHLDRSRRTK